MKKILFAHLVSFLIYAAMPLMAQSNINGNVESVPSKTPAFARLTFMNLADTTQKNVAFTDSLTGLYSLQNVPNGPTERKVEVWNHWLFKDTVNVNGNQAMDFQIIKDLGSTSTVHPNILNAFKTLTGTLDLFYPFTKTQRWNDYALPLNFCANNDSIPTGVRQYLDSALMDFVTKSDGKVQFNEVSANPDTGIIFRYRDAAHMPCPGASGCIYYDSFFSDRSPKHMTIYINTQIPPTQFNGVFRRELMRAMITYDYSTDPLYIQSINSQASELHPDEGKILQILYTLKHNTDMLAHRETVINDPLPVELVSFTAKLIGKDAELKWQTATEINNYGFEIERSSNVGEWDRVGFVEGNGNSNSPKYYTFIDNHPSGGSKFKYRLKQIDTDGQYEYSNEVEVNLVINNFGLSQNYPNPFNPTTKIEFRIADFGFVNLKVYDILGREVATLVNEEKPAGEYEVEFNAANFPSGIYFYQMLVSALQSKDGKAGQFSETRKMVLLR